MTVQDKATLGKLSAECPGCRKVDRLSAFADHYGDHSGLAVISCKCGCGHRWRRIDTVRGFMD